VLFVFFASINPYARYTLSEHVSDFAGISIDWPSKTSGTRRSVVLRKYLAAVLRYSFGYHRGDPLAVLRPEYRPAGEEGLHSKSDDPDETAGHVSIGLFVFNQRVIIIACIGSLQNISIFR